jgi:hypothetical protein
MIGNQVEVTLSNPEASVTGELRKQTVEGVWIYGGWAEQAAVTFYPQHRIVEIVDRGYRPR